jgi:hypothetical protein
MPDPRSLVPRVGAGESDTCDPAPEWPIPWPSLCPAVHDVSVRHAFLTSECPLTAAESVEFTLAATVPFLRTKDPRRGA